MKIINIIDIHIVRNIKINTIFFMYTKYYLYYACYTFLIQIHIISKEYIIS